MCCLASLCGLPDWLPLPPAHHPLHAVAMSADIGSALVYLVTACATPTGASPSGPVPEPVPADNNGGGDLGDYGAAALPALEAARHDAFMQMIGGAPVTQY